MIAVARMACGSRAAVAAVAEEQAAAAAPREAHEHHRSLFSNRPVRPRIQDSSAASLSRAGTACPCWPGFQHARAAQPFIYTLVRGAMRWRPAPGPGATRSMTRAPSLSSFASPFPRWSGGRAVLRLYGTVLYILKPVALEGSSTPRHATWTKRQEEKQGRGPWRLL